MSVVRNKSTKVQTLCATYQCCEQEISIVVQSLQLHYANYKSAVQQMLIAWYYRSKLWTISCNTIRHCIEVLEHFRSTAYCDIIINLSATQQTSYHFCVGTRSQIHNREYMHVFKSISKQKECHDIIIDYMSYMHAYRIAEVESGAIITNKQKILHLNDCKIIFWQTLSYRLLSQICSWKWHIPSARSTVTISVGCISILSAWQMMLWHFMNTLLTEQRIISISNSVYSSDSRYSSYQLIAKLVN